MARGLPCADPAVATLGYREPSLVFLLGTKLEMVETPGAAEQFLRGNGCRVAFVDTRFIDAVRRLAANDNLPLRDVGTVAGFNINGGHRATIAVVSPGAP